MTASTFVMIFKSCYEFGRLAQLRPPGFRSNSQADASSIIAFLRHAGFRGLLLELGGAVVLGGKLGVEREFARKEIAPGSGRRRRLRARQSAFCPSTMVGCSCEAGSRSHRIHEASL